MSVNQFSENTEPLSRKNKGLLALVIFLGILILVATTVLVFVVIGRITHKKDVASQIGTETQSVLRPVSILQEPAGTRISHIMRQSDHIVVMTLTGGGSDRLVFWDLQQQKKIAEVKLSDSHEENRP